MNTQLQPVMQNPAADTLCDELELIAHHVPLEGATVLELGCGTARMTRLIAGRFPIGRIIATDVDEIQHARNLASEHPPVIEFRYGGAQAIDMPDSSVDVVFMFKSLHHVPHALMARGLREVARVLKPRGLLWVSEPVYAGEFNEILRLFNDEKVVREQAFAALRAAAADGVLEWVEQIFCNTESRFASFEEFEQRIINATHSHFQLDEALYREVRGRFCAHLGTDGARFENPQRIDVLRKPA